MNKSAKKFSSAIAGAAIAVAAGGTDPAPSPAADVPPSLAPAAVGAGMRTDPKLLKDALLAQADLPEGYKLAYGPAVKKEQFHAEMGVCQFGTELKGDAVAVNVGSVTFSKVLDDMDVTQELLDVGAVPASDIVVDA